MATIKMPKPIKRPTSEFYWIRKKVPVALRPLVGKTEIWATLGTKDERLANIKIGAVNATIEAEWTRLRAEAARTSSSPGTFEPEPFKLTHQDLHALRREEHARIRDRWMNEPPTGIGKLRIYTTNEELLELQAVDLLESGGFARSEANIDRLVPLLVRARREAASDIEHARVGEYDKVTDLTKLPARTTPALDFVTAFEEYAAKGGLKGGSAGRTASRWRPKIKEFCDFVRHRDLKRIKTSDGYDWVDRLVEKGIPRDSIRKVWLAALSATAGFMVERRKLDQNPFLGIRVRDADVTEDVEKERQQKEPPRKGFTPEEAKRILTATLVAPSDFISVEMAAARRWLPWLCAYSGARVNELTSLYPDDIRPYSNGVWCMNIKPSLEKTEQWRIVPIHSHVIEQDSGQKFLDYVADRRKLNKPLFYDPVRRRGGTVRHPQFHKVAERVGEWVHRLGIPFGVKPNHGWRHVFKSMARHVKMDREVEGFITGHRPKDAGSGNDYGDHWIQTMSAEIERYPRYEIAALDLPPAPHKRRRRINFDVEVAKAAKEARKAAREARATGATK
jgi:site-specific recombinase XerD